MGCCATKEYPELHRESKSSIHLPINPGQFIKLNRGDLSLNYTTLETIGYGTFGRVAKVAHKETGQERALKTVKKSMISADLKQMDMFMNEINALRIIDHPNIIKLYEFFEDDNEYFMITELVTGGELFDFLMQTGKLSESMTSQFMRQLMSAVAYCHSIGIVHRDIKPENLLLDSSHTSLKLIDFGTSALTYRQGEALEKLYGTAYYMAPEIFTKNYNEKCDLWSCGVLLYLLLCGSPPFKGNSDPEIISHIKNSEPSYAEPAWKHVSDEARSLVERLLDRDVGRRISAVEALEHEFLLRPHDQLSSSQVKTALKNLKHFSASQKLQHAVYTYIASQLYSKTEAQELAKAFTAIDVNGDGKLSREELLTAYSTIMSLEQAQAQVQSIMSQVDMDNSGDINYTEFVVAATHKDSLVTTQNLKNCFNLFDNDGSGSISCDELKAILGADGKIAPEVWDELIREVDVNQDGAIDFEEFRRMMQRVI
jgi:calcium-dependent protein kinase